MMMDDDREWTDLAGDTPLEYDEDQPFGHEDQDEEVTE